LNETLHWGEVKKTHGFYGTSNLQAMTIPIRGQGCQAWGEKNKRL